MLSSNKSFILFYLLGLSLNIAQYILLYNFEIGYLIFMLGVVFNHLVLALSLSMFLSKRTNLLLFTTGIFSKLIILLAAFYYAMNNTRISNEFLVYSYIFQLIILILSTKRLVKKIKDL